jgi:hypothetical protein
MNEAIMRLLINTETPFAKEIAGKAKEAASEA